MGIQASKTSLLHWNYFLALENDLERVSRYIEFSEENYSTYSIELAHLLLAACSEVDVVLKAICKIIEPSSTRENITCYRNIIQPGLVDMIDENAFIDRYGLKLSPWFNWKDQTSGENPDWWKSYNKVKHHRSDSFDKANLENVLNAMGGLFIAVIYYYKLKFEFPEISDFIRDYIGLNDSLISLDQKFYPVLMDHSA